MLPALRRGGLLAALWWLLTGGDPAGWALGVPIVLVATLAAQALAARRATRPRTVAIPGFLLFLAVQSILGAADVARRVLLPGGRWRPGLVRVPLALPEGSARTFLAATLCLVPGTITARVEPDGLLVHALDCGQDVTSIVRRFEARIAALYGTPIEGEGP